jgi:hypothetical protein
VIHSPTAGLVFFSALPRRASACFALLLLIACGAVEKEAAPGAQTSTAPNDPAHRNVTGPHGDHSPRHGGVVLMNGDVHYEVVFSGEGRHQIWFSDAVRNELPASVATGVTLEVARPGVPVEVLTPAIDDAGEAWIANGRPVEGEGVLVKIRYALQGEQHEIEVPFMVPEVPKVP